MKFGSLIADIFHDAEVNAGNSIKVKHRRVVDFNALQGTTLNHQTAYKKVSASPIPYGVWLDAFRNLHGMRSSIALCG